MGHARERVWSEQTQICKEMGTVTFSQRAQLQEGNWGICWITNLLGIFPKKIGGAGVTFAAQNKCVQVNQSEICEWGFLEILSILCMCSYPGAGNPSTETLSWFWWHLESHCVTAVGNITKKLIPKYQGELLKNILRNYTLRTGILIYCNTIWEIDFSIFLHF